MIHLLEDIAKTAAEAFEKNIRDNVNKDLYYWKEKLIELNKAKQEAKTQEDIDRIKKTEEFAFANVSTLKARFDDKVESQAWIIGEKILTIIRNSIIK